LPLFWYNKALGIARNLKVSLRLGRVVRVKPSFWAEFDRHRQELAQVKEELRIATVPVERKELKKRKKKLQQTLSQLGREVGDASGAQDGPTAPRAENGSESGALPDFAIIGVKKGGTTFLYHLLSQHPYVEPAAAKEVHFFDTLFDEGVDWYRRCFPSPRWKDGRRTITGEATPYMASRRIPERMAEVVPQARLIALLRNPVDRAFSHYQQALRKRHETRTFEEAVRSAEASIEAERAQPLDDEGGLSKYRDRAAPDVPNYGYLSKGFYADQLLRWSEFFSREQMLVLKSEDLFARPVDTLKVVLDFLDLPEWEPGAAGLQTEGFRSKRDRRNKGGYKDKMDPTTRRRLEEYFEPHNRRLYDFLGVDFRW
jgi:hypothetical protein